MPPPAGGIHRRAQECELLSHPASINSTEVSSHALPPRGYHELHVYPRPLTSPFPSPTRARSTTVTERVETPIAQDITIMPDDDSVTNRHASNVKKHSAAYRAKNRDILREKNRQWKLANKERVALQKAAYREKNRDKIRAHDREIYQQKVRAKQPAQAGDAVSSMPQQNTIDRSMDTDDTVPVNATPPIRAVDVLSSPVPRQDQNWTVLPVDISHRLAGQDSLRPTVAANSAAIHGIPAAASSSLGVGNTARNDHEDFNASLVAAPASAIRSTALLAVGTRSTAASVGPQGPERVAQNSPSGEAVDDPSSREDPDRSENGVSNPTGPSSKKPRARNMEKQAEYDRKYRRRHKEALATKSRVYYHTSKDKVLAYKAKNRDKVLATTREWKQRNKEYVQAQRKAYRERNLERIREHDRAMYRAKKGQAVDAAAENDQPTLSTEAPVDEHTRVVHML